jgi:hypothetical protein
MDPAGTVGVIGPDGGGPAPDAGTPDPALRFVQPVEGAAFTRDSIVGTTWVATVMVALEATGVDRVEIRLDDTPLLALGEAPFEGVVHVRDEGELTLLAVGLAPDGTELVRDEVGIVVGPPTDASCHSMLDALGLDWTAAAATRGIADPITLEPVIRGVSFRYVSRAEPTPMLMDCSLASRLSALVDLVEPYGIDEVIHIGIYNYRCIGGGDPDSGSCTPSQHAYATAIDIHAFGFAGSDTVYSTETDWVIRDDIDVCPGMPAGEADTVLHEIACAMWSERIFHIVLTPDYNAAHRNHFHVDLTDGSMFIGETVTGVDPWIPGLGH